MQLPKTLVIKTIQESLHNSLALIINYQLDQPPTNLTLHSNTL